MTARFPNFHLQLVVPEERDAVFLAVLSNALVGEHLPPVGPVRSDVAALVTETNDRRCVVVLVGGMTHHEVGPGVGRCQPVQQPLRVGPWPVRTGR